MFPSLSWLMLLATLLAFGVAKFILQSVLQLIIEAGFVRPNFRGDQIPVGAGLLFFLSVLPAAVLLLAWQTGDYQRAGVIFLFVMGAMTLLGLVDDIFGSRAASGLKGHIKRMLQGELTTGGLKLLAGGFISLAVAIIISSDWLQVLVNTLVIALSINAINLLDLRPGRAGKGFLFAGLLLFIAGWPSEHLAWLAITMGALLAYLPYDLKAKAMMGDTGSNALGATVGITAALVLPHPIKLGYLVFLIAFHILTEKYSLTKIIEKNKMLNYLDQLGRS